MNRREQKRRGEIRREEKKEKQVKQAASGPVLNHHQSKLAKFR